MLCKVSSDASEANEIDVDTLLELREQKVYRSSTVPKCTASKGRSCSTLYLKKAYNAVSQF
uniref:Uncharacterized protein n=1 Tax=Arundo donax TaxID=35708 RepID=A0A0A9HQC7_ARUDO